MAANARCQTDAEETGQGSWEVHKEDFDKLDKLKLLINILDIRKATSGYCILGENWGSFSK